MKVQILLNDPQNSYNPYTVINIPRRHVFTSFTCQPYHGCMAEKQCLMHVIVLLPNTKHYFVLITSCTVSKNRLHHQRPPHDSDKNYSPVEGFV